MRRSCWKRATWLQTRRAQCGRRRSRRSAPTPRTRTPSCRRGCRRCWGRWRLRTRPRSCAERARRTWRAQAPAPWRHRQSQRHTRRLLWRRMPAGWRAAAATQLRRQPWRIQTPQQMCMQSWHGRQVSSQCHRRCRRRRRRHRIGCIAQCAMTLRPSAAPQAVWSLFPKAGNNENCSGLFFNQFCLLSATPQSDWKLVLVIPFRHRLQPAVIWILFGNQTAPSAITLHLLDKRHECEPLQDIGSLSFMRSWHKV